MSLAYHPKTDDQIEVLNKTLEMYLRCFCYENPKSWLTMLPWAQFWYNTTVHSSIKMSPYKALFGKDPPSVVKYEVSPQDETSLQEMLIARDKTLEQLKTNMMRAEEFMKNFADKRRRQLEFEKGELVLVKLQSYRQHSVALRKNQKLGMKYFGPFPINKKLSAVAYRLELPAEARIHNVFHISVLKKFRGEHHSQYLPLPLQTSEMGPILQPHAIVGSRIILQNGKEVQQVQVQWGHGSAAENTWEKAEEFYKDYPQINLEGKVEPKGEGNIMRKNKANVFMDTNEASEAENDEELQINEEHEFVRNEGHVAGIPSPQELRRSSRVRPTNRMLKDFVC